MKKKIKLLIFIQEIGDGGAETLVKDYILNLDKTIFDIFLLTEEVSDYKSANYKILSSHGINIICPITNGHTIFERIIKKCYVSYIPKAICNCYQHYFLSKKIMQISPDIIHCHLNVLKYLSPISNKIKKARILYTCHSMPEVHLSATKCIEENKAAKVLLKNNNFTFVALHNEMRKELNEMFGVKNTIVLENGVDLAKFKIVKETKSQIRQDLRIPLDAFVMGHVGRFVKVKNHDFLIDIFYELTKRQKDAFLLLIGGGDSSNVIKKLNEYDLKDRCLILSNRNDIHRLMKAMDSFVFPSIYEGFPIVCIEAQASSLKCVVSKNITSDILLTKNIIKEDITKSPSIWAEDILNNIENRHVVNNIENYDVKNVIKKLTNLYLEQQ